MPEHFNLSELQITKQAIGIVLWILYSTSFFFLFLPYPHPHYHCIIFTLIHFFRYLMLTAGINSPFTLSLSFVNKVICLLEPDPTCKYISFIWAFLLRCMGQPFWALESCSHLIFFLWSTCTLAAQLKSPQIFQPVETHNFPLKCANDWVYTGNSWRHFTMTY